MNMFAARVICFILYYVKNVNSARIVISQGVIVFIIIIIIEENYQQTVSINIVVLF